MPPQKSLIQPWGSSDEPDFSSSLIQPWGDSGSEEDYAPPPEDLFDLWEKAPFNQPLTDAPSRFASWINENQVDPTPAVDFAESILPGSGDYITKMDELRKRINQGVGDFATGMTTPLNVATLGTAGAEYGAGKLGYQGIKGGLGILGSMLGAPDVVTGTVHTLHGVQEGDPVKIGLGIVEGVGGALDAGHLARRAKPPVDITDSFARGEQMDLPFGPVDTGGRGLERQGFDAGREFGPEISPYGLPNPNQGSFNFETGKPRIVTLKTPNPTAVAELRADGYVEISPNQWARSDIAPMYALPGPESTPPPRNVPPPPPPTSPITPSTTPAPNPLFPEGLPPEITNVPPDQTRRTEGAFEAHEVEFGQPISIPLSEITPKLILEMAENGYKMEGRTPDGSILFTPKGPGSADENKIVTNLRVMLGRQPTSEEVAAAIAREAGTGDVTGRVAPFIQPTPPGPTNLAAAPGGRFSNTINNFLSVARASTVNNGMLANQRFNELIRDIEAEIDPNVIKAELDAFKDQMRGIVGTAINPNDVMPMQTVRQVLERRLQILRGDLKAGAAQWPPNSGNLVRPVNNPPVSGAQMELPAMGPTQSIIGGLHPDVRLGAIADASQLPPPDLSLSIGPKQEPLPLSSDLTDVKKFGPGAMVPDELPPPDTFEARRIRREGIVQNFRRYLDPARDYRNTDFILPDGTKLAHNEPIHEYGARKAKTTLPEALDAGVMRVSSMHGGTVGEVRGPITTRQARELMLMRVHNGHELGYVDVNTPSGEIHAKTFNDRMKPDALVQWVNSYYPNEGIRPGTQMLLPDFRHVDLEVKTPKPEPGVQVFNDYRQIQLPFEHPTVQKFREGFKHTDDYRQTKFILPEGERLTFLGGMHRDAAAGIKMNLEEAQKYGVIRYRDGAADIGSPITIAQARHLVDGRLDLRLAELPVDLRFPDGSMVSKTFGFRAKANAVYNWVNDQFKKFMKDETGAMPIPQWAKDSAEWIKDQTGIGRGDHVTGQHAPKEFNFIKEALQVPKNLMTTLDLSAPGRQGLGMVLTPQFWTALAKMPLGMHKATFDKMDANLRSKPVFTRKFNTKTQKFEKSIADKAGLKLYEPASTAAPGTRAESIASRWLETGGNIPFASAVWKHTAGQPIRMSNRAYITFLNELRANRFEFLMNQSKNMSAKGIATGKVRPNIFQQNVTKQEAENLNGYRNDLLAKEIADFVNTATGAAPLKTHAFPHRNAVLSAEKAAGFLSYTMFSPGLFASRVRMLNPMTYMMASPQVRKEYLRSALGMATAWWGSLYMLKMMGGDEVEVGLNPTSSDFGKAKIGNLRLDPGGGASQFVTLIGRALHGGYTSSARPEEGFHKFGEGFQAETQWSNLLRFATNKLEPMTKFAVDVADASEYKPFHVYDRVAQSFVPLFAQDVYQLVREDPSLAPWAIPALFGVGTQYYEQGESEGRLVEPEGDWLAEGGGGLKRFMPWNIGTDDSDEWPEDPY